MKYQYWFMDVVVDEGRQDLYFFGANIRGFFKWDLRSNTVFLLDDMKEYPFNNEMYMNGLLKNGKIYFPPRMTEKMAVYDLDHKNMKLYELYDKAVAGRIHFHPSLEGHNIINGNDESIFIMYRNAPCCVKWNTQTDEAQYIFCEDGLEESVILSRDYANIGTSYYFPSVISNLVVQFDMEKEELSLHRLPGCEKYKYSSIVSEGDSLCLVTIDGAALVFWNPKDGTVDVKSDICTEGDYNHNYRLLSDKGKIYLFPMIDFAGDMENMIVFDIKTEMKEIRHIFHDYHGYKKWRTFSFGKKWGYVLYQSDNEDRSNIYWLKNAIYICVDMEDGSVMKFDLPLPDGWDSDALDSMIIRCQSKNYCDIFNAGFMVNESLELNVQRFLDIVGSMS